MLKAYLVRERGETSIYYKDNPDRTITLENCIRLIFTNNKDPLRRNLERIIELRNTSTHFITEEYEQIYVPLFQACVLNYINKLLDFFDIDITEKLGNNFLTLSVKMSDLNESEIRARYPQKMADRILRAMGEVGKSIVSTDHSKYAIPVRHDFYITKNKKQASTSFTFTKDADQAAFILKERHDMQKVCPYRQKDCLEIINKRLQKEKIPFVNPRATHVDRRGTFNKYCFGLFTKFYQLKSNDKYCYVYNRNTTPAYTYSMAAIDVICEQIKKDPEHIIQNLRSKIGQKKGSQPQGQRNSKP